MFFYLSSDDLDILLQKYICQIASNHRPVCNGELYVKKIGEHQRLKIQELAASLSESLCQREVRVLGATCWAGQRHLWAKEIERTWLKRHHGTWKHGGKRMSRKSKGVIRYERNYSRLIMFVFISIMSLMVRSSVCGYCHRTALHASRILKGILRSFVYPKKCCSFWALHVSLRGVWKARTPSLAPSQALSKLDQEARSELRELAPGSPSLDKVKAENHGEFKPNNWFDMFQTFDWFIHSLTSICFGSLDENVWSLKVWIKENTVFSWHLHATSNHYQSLYVDTGRRILHFN